MKATNLTKVYVGANYETAAVTEADLETRIMRYDPITTTQRNALTAEAGMEIYNSTTNQMEFHNGSSWAASSG